MAGAFAQTGYEARKRRRMGVIVAVSALAHVVVLALVGLSAPKLVFKDLPPERAIYVWLSPDLTRRTHTSNNRPAPKASSAPAASAPARASPTARPVRPVAAPTPHPASPRPAPPAPPIKAPAAPSAPSAPTVPGGAPAGRSSALATVEGEGGGAEQALRTSVGCDYEHMVHLSPAERDKCSQSIGATAKRAPTFNGIDPAKRARFDEQVAADERRRAARTGPMAQPIGACEGQQSNLGGGCLSDSAIGHLRIPSPNN